MTNIENYIVFCSITITMEIVWLSDISFGHKKNGILLLRSHKSPTGKKHWSFVCKNQANKLLVLCSTIPGWVFASGNVEFLEHQYLRWGGCWKVLGPTHFIILILGNSSGWELFSTLSYTGPTSYYWYKTGFAIFKIFNYINDL